MPKSKRWDNLVPARDRKRNFRGFVLMMRLSRKERCRSEMRCGRERENERKKEDP